ncbi:translation initiation factor IF-3 [Arthrobacter glacialis]|uniref:Translation initiation factor IF-3 n=1 Tax=Arthrobacter glacialis TaxID=1664 RepID=A0A2S3ZUJ0_ARTGL|nr:translation initiation factor IF-3 [Arthrobacter glacialis]POH72759.1 translation initiation factor IF-3 [Arthrobacter glacialis]
MQQELHISEPRINDRIRVPEVRLVGPAGEQVGVVRIEDALRLAAESDLDLVEVAPTAKPPVCKLMDFGKYKYEAAVKAREARKNQTNTVLKEIRFRLKIDTHDYETKRGHALKFLGAGDKVKAMIQFRGREQQRPEMGIRLLQKFAADVAEVGIIESSPRIDGRNMVMVIGPLKNKAEAKAEARRNQQRADAKAHNEAVANGTARVDVDRDNKAPMTQSLADLLPEGLRLNEEVPAAEAVQAPVAEAADAVVETAAVVEAPAAVVAPAASAPVAVSAPAVAPVAKAPAKSAAPKAAAAKAPVAKAPAAKVAAKAPAAKPAVAPKPVAAPKPVVARPIPMPKPMAKPVIAKPAAKPAAKTATKTAAKPASAKSEPAAETPSSAE